MGSRSVYDLADRDTHGYHHASTNYAIQQMNNYKLVIKLWTADCRAAEVHRDCSLGCSRDARGPSHDVCAVRS